VKADAFDARRMPERGGRGLAEHRVRRLWDAAAGVGVYLRTMIVFLLVWQGAAMWIGNPILLPTPIEVAKSFVELAGSGEMVTNIVVSVTRLVVSFLLAAVVAVPLGFAMGLNRTLFEMIDPTVELLRPISGIAWIPLALFIFGVGNALPVFIMTYAGFFPILLGTVAGVRGVDRRLIDAARTMGVPRQTIVTRVVVPAALPSLMVALRLGVATSWTAVVAAELIGAPSGLGYAVEWYRELLMTPQVMTFIAMIGVLGYVCDRLARVLLRVFAPWSTSPAAT